MQNIARLHKVRSILLFCALLAFFRLGAGEIQPWDEGLYASRARTILLFGNFWDQTPHAPGGLYSATYPPLTMWAMAGSMYVLGENATAVRLFSALCSGLALLLLYLIGRRFMSWEFALLAAALLAGTLAWNVYARQGMTDVPLVTFLLLALYAGLRLRQARDRKNLLRWGALFALAFGAALMTKILVSFLPLLFVAGAWLDKHYSRDQRFVLGLAALLGIIAALPWHYSMFLQYGTAFSNAFLAPHLYSSVEGPRPETGWWYYLNQLVIANPVCLPALLFAAALLVKRRALAVYSMNIAVETILAVWFLGTLLLFSIAETRMPHYTLLMLPPAILLGVRGLELLVLRYMHTPALWLTLCALILLSLWGIFPELRQGLKTLAETGSAGLGIYVYLGALVLLPGAAFVLPPDTRTSLHAHIITPFTIILPLLLLGRVALWNANDGARLNDGALPIATVLERSDESSFVYLCHQRNAGDLLNPQLGWYTRGWLYGWRAPRVAYTVGIPETQFSAEALRAIDKYPFSVLIYYYSPQYGRLSGQVRAAIQRNQAELMSTNRYIMFGPAAE